MIRKKNQWRLRLIDLRWPIERETDREIDRWIDRERKRERES